MFFRVPLLFYALVIPQTVIFTAPVTPFVFLEEAPSTSPLLAGTTDYYCKQYWYFLGVVRGAVCGVRCFLFYRQKFRFR